MSTVNRPPVAELYDHAARLRRLEEVLVEVMGHLDAVSSQLIEQAELTRSNMLAINELENTVATIAQGLMALSRNLDRTETRLENQHDAIQKLIEALNILTGKPSHDL